MASAIVNLVIEKLGDFAVHEAALIIGVGDQIVHLRDKFQWLQAFLKDAEQRRRDDNNELIGVWVNQIRDVAYDVEDVLDEFSLNFDLRRLRDKDAEQRRWDDMDECSLNFDLQHSNWAWINCFVAWINCFGIANLLRRHHLAKQIESINVRLQEIANSKSQFIQRDEAPSSSSSPSLALRYEMEEDVVGLEEDTKNLKQQLLDLDKSQRVVISIVGLEGLGKTTLANKIYKDMSIVNHFGFRAWVSVSQTYRIKDLLKSILKVVVGLSGTNAEEMEESEMITKVCECLSDKTYLIVLDDVWDTTTWDGLKAAFPKQTGSRVLLTTRKKNVGSYVNPDGHLYEMRSLRGEEIWQLFCNKTFQNSNCPDHLKPLKEDIIQKCSGLPLATVVLGGLLRSKVHITDSYTEWKKVLKFITVAPGEVQNQTRRILSLSYDELPHYLKSCFLYFSSFPEDFDIYVPRLIQMWVAEGFIQHDNQELQMEDLAERYMNELVERCMIQLKEKDVDGSIRFVRIHDLLLDLAHSEAKEANFLEIYDNLVHVDLPPNLGILRRLFQHRRSVDHDNLNLNHGSFLKLRSLALIDPYQFGYEMRFLFSVTKLLKVISLAGVEIESLPSEIVYMVHLRFLNLSNTRLKRLPSIISNLCYLQTLNLRNTDIMEIPKEFWTIQTLRHVYLPDPFLIVPELFSNLNDLQTLDGVRGGEWIHEGWEKLRNLRHLYIQHVSYSEAEALSNTLAKLEYLSTLSITDAELIPTRILTDNHQLQILVVEGPLGIRDWDQMLERHQLLPNLKKLLLAKSDITQNDLVIFGALANLKHLVLFYDTSGERELVFSTGWFPRLEKLIMVGMDALEDLTVEGGAMPCLLSLTIAYCPELKMLPDGLRHLSTLKVLKIVGMRRIQKRMEKNAGEDYPKIEHVPFVSYHENSDVVEYHPRWTDTMGGRF